MDSLRYWQLKIYQLLHDPPSKAFHLAARGEGSKASFLSHSTFARELFSLFSSSDAPRGVTRPDQALSGADRPVVAAGSGHGRTTALPYQGAGDNLLVHPLAPNAALLLAPADGTAPEAPDEIREDDDAHSEVMSFLQRVQLDGWSTPDAVKHAALVLWRRTRDELMLRSMGERAHREGDPLWERMPADIRVPDHSIWDHTRMVAAMAFIDAPMGAKNPVPAVQEPWLLQVSLSPIGEFIRQSRKGQDLWLSSFLLADLAWHAMLPIVERYGPENIVSPDLRGNARVDHWLHTTHPDALPDFVKDNDPSTFAALLPNKFVAIVPRGGAGALQPLQDIARECVEAVAARWSSLAEMVLEWFIGQSRKHNALAPAEEIELRRLWTEQHRSVIHARWTAVPWRTPEHISAPLARFGALPAQDRAKLPRSSPEDLAADEARAKRLRPWVPKEVWNHYEKTRDVFARVDLALLQGERGFDYALTYHQLQVRHVMRKQSSLAPGVAEQPGEKCTLCGQRTALGDFGAALDPRRAAIESRRQRVREFWSQEWLDPEESGAERLCSVCTFKRLLVEADGDNDNGAINATWAGITTNPDKLREGGKVRTPFPSTTAIAAQHFLAAVATRPDLASEVTAVSRAHRDAELPETQFPRALPRLAAACGRGDSEVLRLEPQETVFPRALDAPIARLKEELRDEHDSIRSRSIERKLAGMTRLRLAVEALLEAAREPPREGRDERPANEREPGKRFAVIQIDGDWMGKLLLGDPARVKATWRDVIHPKHVQRMLDSDALRAAGWPSLLDEKRLMGPSMHAFVSRALVDFTHRIVPWVVEREHDGRLVYAGGDDVLALAPADQAMAIAARLQELFSAAWIIDTDYEVDTWAWRRPGAAFEHDTDKARRRFQIQPEGNPVLVAEGPLLAMLGKGSSLSAGIALGHFKTPLSGMLKQARHLLEDVAKDGAERSAAALSYQTRSGPKYQFTMKWDGGAMPEDYRVPAKVALETAVSAFESGVLPSRLPYKLRETGPSLLGALDGGANKGELLRGVLRVAMDGKKLDTATERAVLALWWAQLSTHEEASRAVDGLLLARALAAGEPEDEG